MSRLLSTALRTISAKQVEKLDSFHLYHFNLPKGKPHGFPQINSLELSRNILAPICHYYNSKRFKYTKRKKDDSDSSDSDEEERTQKDSKIVKRNMTSLRADGVLRAGLGIARNKIEAMFYESRIRVNGSKIQKKSLKVNVGDEIDLIKRISPFNEDFLDVSRVEIISCSADEDEEEVEVKMRVFKTLTIENYSDSPWKGHESN